MKHTGWKIFYGACFITCLAIAWVLIIGPSEKVVFYDVGAIFFLDWDMY
jgi:hypothetical protein